MNQQEQPAMNNESMLNNARKMASVFERFLCLWVVLCIVAGILLGKIAPGLAQCLDGLALYVKGTPVVSIDHSVDRHSALYPDHADLLVGLWTGASA
jgi:ACR3 family arsenite transporter